MKKIAIQGGVGAYHGIAAENYFEEEVDILPCQTFREIFEAIEQDASVIGIMAIENTIAGSLLPNYELLKMHNMPIAGEYKQRISHCLVALPGTKLAEVKEIWSHPIALMQCVEYTDALPNVKIIEHVDTALAAKEISEKNIEGVAAICSKKAAEIYGLEILAEGIETNKHNFTRFLIVAQPWVVDELQQGQIKNKASIVFTTPHTEGSLSHVLSVLSFYDINLTKIQSLPIIGREWEYQFYADVKYNDVARFYQSLHAIKPLTSDLKILGEYVDGRQSEN